MFIVIRLLASRRLAGSDLMYEGRTFSGKQAYMAAGQFSIDELTNTGPLLPDPGTGTSARGRKTCRLKTATTLEHLPAMAWWLRFCPRWMRWYAVKRPARHITADFPLQLHPSVKTAFFSTSHLLFFGSSHASAFPAYLFRIRHPHSAVRLRRRWRTKRQAGGRRHEHRD
ncbi:hypothetical protein [Noviherbaspirillum humi]|uniref:hypothetical protein n=1 Tax=Noviherbaspirillum humi TaxID=1688639 RepID=UPI001160A925|nr:hypothetical protein [Noviherbaspirillum humi]